MELALRLRADQRCKCGQVLLQMWHTTGQLHSYAIGDALARYAHAHTPCVAVAAAAAAAVSSVATAGDTRRAGNHAATTQHKLPMA
jgi:hypothetical protein